MLHLTASRPALPDEPSGSLYILDNPEDCLPREINWREALEPEPLYSRDLADRPMPGDDNYFKDPMEPVFGDIDEGAGNGAGEEEPGGNGNGNGEPVDPDAPGGADNPHPDDVGEPDNPENPDNPANNPAAEFFIDTGDSDPVFNLWAGAAVCAHGQNDKIENPISFLRYKAEPTEGCYQIAAEDCYLVIVAAVKLVLKDGVDPGSPDASESRLITVKCSGLPTQEIACVLGVVSYAVFHNPVPLEFGDYEAMEKHFYHEGPQWSREAKRILKMPQFEGMRYAFYPKLKSVLEPTKWELSDAPTESKLWAGTATLEEF